MARTRPAIHTLVSNSVSTFALLGLSALAASPAFAMDVLARVISSTPVVVQVLVPRQVCTQQTGMAQGQPSGAGAIMGAVAGGAMGNASGDDGGRALATMLGLVGGAMLGNSIEGGQPEMQQQQNCSTQNFYENRPSHYQVVYEYQGTRHAIQMASDPGIYVRVRGTPEGVVQQAAPQPTYAAPNVVQPSYPLPNYPQPTYQPPVYPQPTYPQVPYPQPTHNQPSYNQSNYAPPPTAYAPQVVYVQSAQPVQVYPPAYYGAPVYVQQAPSYYYARPSYRPRSYIGLSIGSRSGVYGSYYPHHRRW